MTLTSEVNEATVDAAMSRGARDLELDLAECPCAGGTLDKK